MTDSHRKNMKAIKAICKLATYRENPIVSHLEKRILGKYLFQNDKCKYCCNKRRLENSQNRVGKDLALKKQHYYAHNIYPFNDCWIKIFEKPHKTGARYRE